MHNGTLMFHDHQWWNIFKRSENRGGKSSLSTKLDLHIHVYIICLLSADWWQLTDNKRESEIRYEWIPHLNCIWGATPLTPPPPHTHTHTHTLLVKFICKRTMQDKVCTSCLFVFVLFCFVLFCFVLFLTAGNKPLMWRDDCFFYGDVET